MVSRGRLIELSRRDVSIRVEEDMEAGDGRWRDWRRDPGRVEVAPRSLIRRLSGDDEADTPLAGMTSYRSFDCYGQNGEIEEQTCLEEKRSRRESERD